MQKKMDERPRKASLIHLPPSVRHPLCQIANLVFPEQGTAVRNLERATEISEPSTARLLEISRGILGKRRADAAVWEAKNPGWERQLSPELVPENKKRLDFAKNATLRRDASGNEIPLHEARQQYLDEEYDKPQRRQKLSELAERAGEYQRELLSAAKQATQGIWPELWGNDSPGEQEHALHVLLKVQAYLHLFWKAKTPRDRDWYIHRVRDYYQRNFVLPKTSLRRKERDEAEERCRSASTKEEFQEAVTRLSSAYQWVNIESENLLDHPPSPSPFEAALYMLQTRSGYKSKAPRVCGNKSSCPHPYFLPVKKTRKHCSPQCAYAVKLKQNREYKQGA